MHGAALSVLARIERAVVTDDGLEPVRSWVFFQAVSGFLTPASLTFVTRVGLRADQVTHSLVVGHGIPFDLSEYRVVVGDRAYELVSASNLPAQSVLLLRVLPEIVVVGS
jgi:hypothetical protein